jgi:hypothetical protein
MTPKKNLVKEEYVKENLPLENLLPLKDLLALENPQLKKLLLLKDLLALPEK